MLFLVFNTRLLRLSIVLASQGEAMHSGVSLRLWLSKSGPQNPVSLRPFQSFHKVKTIFVKLLKNYLRVLLCWISMDSAHWLLCWISTDSTKVKVGNAAST